MKFPDDFKKAAHPVIPGAVQYKATKKCGTVISIIGGGVGLYGDGVTTFEMWDFSEDDPRGYMTVKDINEYLETL